MAISARQVVRALILPIVLGALATAAGAEPHQVLGYAGLLGEWELTASVVETAASQPKEWSGPLTMTHVGLCTVGDPEEKKGVIRLRVSEARIRATLLVDGVECSYRGRQSDAFAGTLNCPDRPPVPLTIWLK